jgi:hypothetical protein
MRRQQREQPELRTVKDFQPDLLRHDVSALIGQDMLVDAKAAAGVGVDEFEGGHAVFQTREFERAVALLLGEEAGTVGDDEAEVTGAGLIDARIVDLVEDAVAEREPDAADR